MPDTTSPTPFNGSDYDHDRDAPRLTDQMERVFTFLSTHQWVTLGEIAAETGDPEASISAQIRHLRKARFGSWDIQKRHNGQGLFSYRLAGKKAPSTPMSEPFGDCAPLPPAAPELLEIAHKKLGQIQTELLVARAKCDALTAALESIIRAVPAGVFSGECFYEGFDSDGNYIGSQNVDPLTVVQAMAAYAEEGLAAAARLDPQVSPQIPTENP